MSEETSDITPESNPELFIQVRVDHYNSLKDTADIGFVTMVKRRNDLKKLYDRLSQYPERDSRKINSANDEFALINDDIPIDKDDVHTLLVRIESRIKSASDALNFRLQNPRYK